MDVISWNSLRHVWQLHLLFPCIHSYDIKASKTESAYSWRISALALFDCQRQRVKQTLFRGAQRFCLKNNNAQLTVQVFLMNFYLPLLPL